VEAKALSGLPVTVVGNDERDAAVATIVAAFVDDPVERWLYPELDAYRAHFPAFPVSPDKHDDMFSVLDQMDRAHPTFPHWYLPWFGVRPELQGGGLGGRLLEDCLRVVDESRLPAYLETPNPRTIPFYERHGFETVSVAVAGACPPVTSMLRRLPAARATVAEVVSMP
jgi:GNAT superfamily N-acetyltransferase